MSIRARSLPAGWYPTDRTEAIESFERWISAAGDSPTRTACSVIVPHAGWFFSGDLAYLAIREIPAEIETVIVAGGHLRPNDPVLLHVDEAAETPFGILPSDLVIVDSIKKRFTCRIDTGADNTVEVQLPMVRYLFPTARYVGLRVPPSEVAVEIGEAIRVIAERVGRRVAVIGSTDLTHYGSAYGFVSHGTGREAIEWVSGENDRRFIEAMLAMRFADAIEHATKHRAACSAGAAVVAASYARATGVTSGRVGAYRTSADRGSGDSFVGYCSIVYDSPNAAA
jgi:MEMO1 family protein